MSFNRSRLAYDDVKEILDQALETPKGIRVSFPTEGAAIDFRRRANSFRKQDRERSTQLYSRGDPLYGVSLYDKLVLRLNKNDSILFIEFRTTDKMKVEVIE